MSVTSADPDALVAAAADRLETAYERRSPCEPVRDLLGVSDIALAYRVQQAQTRNRLAAGAQVVGRKIGLTSEAVQQQIGVDRPDFGVLFDDMLCPQGEVIAIDRLLQPKAEAEIAFVLREDLAEGALDVDQVRSAVDYAVAALEIVDSRVAGWDLRITDTVADNASSGLFVLGSERVGLDAFDPVEVTMTMHRNGGQVSSGNGAACLGDPLLALQWLARTAREFGTPLQAGAIVLSGALGPMADVAPGDQVTTTISSLGEVSATFSRRNNT